METNTVEWQCDLPLMLRHWSVSTPIGDFGALKSTDAEWFLQLGPVKLVPAMPVLGGFICVTAALVVTLLLRRRRHVA